MIQPPSSGPITGATSVVIAHIAIAVPAFARADSSTAAASATAGSSARRRGPAARGTAISDSMFGARPHSHDASTNSRMLVGEQPHLAEALGQPAGQRHRDRVGDGEAVMTQVPWFGLTPRSPAIAGIDTLAIEVSSTFMNVGRRQRDRAQHERAPVSGPAAHPAQRLALDRSPGRLPMRGGRMVRMTCAASGSGSRRVSGRPRRRSLQAPHAGRPQDPGPRRTPVAMRPDGRRCGAGWPG